MSYKPPRITIEEVRMEEVHNYIRYQLSKFINEPFAQATVDEVAQYIRNQVPEEYPDFKFTLNQNPTRPDTMDITPHNLYTGVFLQEGIIIDPKLTEYRTAYGMYTFVDGKFLFCPDKALEFVSFSTEVKI